MFPYSHMSRDALITAAELEGDGLSKELAAQLVEAMDELADSEKELAWTVKELEDAESEKDEEAKRADACFAQLDTASDRIKALLATIPVKTTHKGLIVIREELTNIQTGLSND
jgi:hypothetical protein